MRKKTAVGSIQTWFNTSHIFRTYRWQWALAILFVFVAASATLSVPLAFRYLIDVGLTSDQVHEPFIYLLIIAIVLALSTATRFI